MTKGTSVTCFDRMVMNCLGMMYDEKMKSTGASDDDDDDDDRERVTESME